MNITMMLEDGQGCDISLVAAFHNVHTDGAYRLISFRRMNHTPCMYPDCTTHDHTCTNKETAYNQRTVNTVHFCILLSSFVHN